MPAAASGHPCDGELLATANRLMEHHPRYRFEIIGGVITVAPLRVAPHARVLTRIMRPFMAAGLDDGETEVLQGIGMWLPSGPEDHVIPDLAIVDADLDEHLAENNCYDPAVFRLVVEVTSSDYNNDLRNKVAAYVEAKIPVYVIVDRKHGRVHVLTEPVGGSYDSHQVYAPGQTVTLPDSIGAPATLDVAELIRAGRPKA
ncbi:Uma2 family endonuclease [Streptomyces sp. NPDC052052]|uniref:Uma2 family endonuclease n=1 Tax=Streptomyces sp. NPDC052052 TaxID=3154756 RepID=UPI003424BC96